MEKIALRNLKPESIIIAFICLGLGGLMIYWASQGNMVLKVSGAKLNKSTSQMFLYLLSMAPLLTSINLFIRFFSLVAYGEFVIGMDHEKITYPVYKMFRGFKKVSFPKNIIGTLQIHSAGKDGNNIWLINKNNSHLGFISPTLYNPRKILSQEIAEKIALWLDKP